MHLRSRRLSLVAIAAGLLGIAAFSWIEPVASKRRARPPLRELEAAEPMSSVALSSTPPAAAPEARAEQVAGARRASAPHSSTARDRVELHGVRSDERFVYLDVAHIDERSDEHDAAPPQVFVNVDGCPSEEVSVAGELRRNDEGASQLAVPQHELPEGDLSLSIRAFGADSSTLVHKRGHEVRTIRMEEREGYAALPADPVYGLPARIQIPGSRSCEQERRAL